MLREESILFETKDFHVTEARAPKKGFWVWQQGVTCCRRVAEIGWEGDKGLFRAKREAQKRQYWKDQDDFTDYIKKDRRK